MVRLAASRQHLRALWFSFGLLGLIAACPCETAQAGLSDAGRFQLAAGVQRARRGASKRVTVPSVSLAVAPTQVRPGGYATYTITTSRINRRRAIWINYAVGGTATMGTDYSLSGTSGQAVIRAGASSSDVALNALPNHLSTGDQVATMILQPGNGYNLSSSDKAAVTIVNPTPTPRPTATPRPTPAPSPSATRQVWIALRTDGKAGSGTAVDPYDGSTAAKFDALLRSFPPYTTIHLGPGTFLTSGSASYNEVQGYWIKPGWKINGAGKELTTVKATLYPAAAGANGHHVFEGDRNVDGDGTEITDLTVDCNWQNLGSARNTVTNAINLFGNNCRISRVKAINAYGHRASLAECFCLAIGPVWTAPATGAVIEECEVSSFRGNYGYAICFPGYGPTVGKVSATVRNNRVTGWIGTAAYSAPGGFNSLFEGNYASGCQCSLYNDTDAIENIEIRNNQFMDCHAFGIFLMPTLGAPGLKNVTIEGNTIEIADYSKGANVAVAIGPASAGHATNITVRGNTILKKTTGTGYTDQAAITISYCDGLLIENNVVDSSLVSSLFVGTPYPNTNVTVQGNTTPLGGIPKGLENRTY